MKKFKIQNAKCKIKVLLILLFSFFILNFPVPAAWFGVGDCAYEGEVSTGYADAMRFQAPADGTSTRLEILTWSSARKSTFRMAVYDDENSHPDNKLWEGTDITYQAEQWCGEDVTTIQLEKDEYYWFSFKVSTTLQICGVPDGPPNSHEWKAGQPYGNPFPDPWGNWSGRNAYRWTMRMHYETEKKCKGIIEIDPGIIEGGFVR